MSKCCYMHFKPTTEFDSTCARVRPYSIPTDRTRAVYVNDVMISKVSSTKFLGIVMDDKLNWEAHLDYLVQKLRSCIGAVCRVRKFIPPDLYLKIYNALFESHLTYGITVWGVALKNRPNEKLFVTQKRCIRILFGDLEKYLNKLSTCARVRPFGYQKLGAELYEKEHTKPIFNRLKLFTVQNAFKHHCILEIFKVLKFRTPYCLFESIRLSRRDHSMTIILPEKSNTFLYKASILWNLTNKRLLSSKSSTQSGFDVSLNLVKLRTKAIIMESQLADMADTWTPKNFQIASVPLPHDQPVKYDSVWSTDIQISVT